MTSTTCDSHRPAAWATRPRAFTKSMPAPLRASSSCLRTEGGTSRSSDARAFATSVPNCTSYCPMFCTNRWNSAETGPVAMTNTPAITAITRT